MVGTITTLIGGTIMIWLVMPIIHELGHALTGWVVGLQHVRIHWQWPVLKTSCQFAQSKSQNFVFSVGGIATQGLCVAAVALVAHSPIVTSLVASYGAIIAINLLPLWPADGYYLHAEVFTKSRSISWMLWSLYGAALVFALMAAVWALSQQAVHTFAFWWVSVVAIVAVGMSIRRSVIMYSVQGDV